MPVVWRLARNWTSLGKESCGSFGGSFFSSGFVVTSRDHRVKKLLQIYWEIVEKTKDTGDLKEEMILVCNALRNDLMHANEFLGV